MITVDVSGIVLKKTGLKWFDDQERLEQKIAEAVREYHAATGFYTVIREITIYECDPFIGYEKIDKEGLRPEIRVDTDLATRK